VLERVLAGTAAGHPAAGHPAEHDAAAAEVPA